MLTAGLQCILRRSRPFDQRRALNRDSLLEKGVECSSWIMGSRSPSFTTLLVSILFSSLSSLLLSSPYIIQDLCNCTSTTNSKTQISFHFVFESFLFCLYNPTPIQPSGPLRMLKCRRSPVNLPGDRSWNWTLGGQRSLCLVLSSSWVTCSLPAPCIILT